MERYWFLGTLWKRGWRVRRQQRKKRLKRVRKHDFVVLPRMYGVELGRVLR